MSSVSVRVQIRRWRSTSPGGRWFESSRAYQCFLWFTCYFHEPGFADPRYAATGRLDLYRLVSGLHRRIKFLLEMCENVALEFDMGVSVKIGRVFDFDSPKSF
jgi:hypothetical protein